MRSRVVSFLRCCFGVLSFVPLTVDVLSGSFVDNAGRAYSNFLALPLTVSLPLCAVGVILLFWRPITFYYLRLEGQLIEQLPTESTLSPATRALSASNVNASVSHDAHQPHSHLAILGRAPGQLGSAPLPDVMLLRKRILHGLVVAPGIGKFSYPKPVECPLCSGRGNKWGLFQETCQQCGGTGELPGELLQYVKCKRCSGTGRKEALFQEECATCHGLGVRGVEPEVLRAILGRNVR